MLDGIETPAVVVNRERLVGNIERVAAIARNAAVCVRPHVKTHKCIEIARLQLEHGAIGITAAKTDEAITFLANGFRSVTIAYPSVDLRKFRRLVEVARHCGAELRIVVDSARGAQVAREVATSEAFTIGVFLKVDVGLHRCGILPDHPELVRLGAEISRSHRLEFRGLLSHAGHAYAAASRDEIAQVAAHECRQMQVARERLAAAGIAVAEVSVGSTPTVLGATTFDGVTEIRPGNYVFLDRTAVRLGLATFDHVALSVFATVVSANDRYLIVDAGSKTLSSDLGAHGTGAGSYGTAFPANEEPGESPGAEVVRLSEEHGWIERGKFDAEIGSTVRILPNHACPVANLAEELVVESARCAVDRWQVAARGKVK